MSRRRRRFDLDDLGQGFYRLILRYGFMQETDVPPRSPGRQLRPQFKMMDTSFFLARQTLIASPASRAWRSGASKLFAWMLRNAESAMEFFKLPPNRVVELGSQVEI
jgi:KUP system potassium uptake protein